MRRYVLIGMILVFLLIGVVVYFFFFDKNNTVVSPNNNASSSLNSGQNSQPKIVTITRTPVLSAVFSLDQTSIWYFGRDGQLYQNALAGENEQKFNLNGANSSIQKVYWPNAGNNFIVWSKAIEGAGSYWSYVSAQQSFVTLPPNIKEVTWMPGGQQILYVWQRADGGWELKLGDPAANNYRFIAELNDFYSLSVAPSGQYALLKSAMVDGGVNKVLMVELDSGQISELLDRGQNVDVLISPDSSKLLFTRVNAASKLPEIWLYDFNAKSFENLGITTSLSKVVWDTSSSGFYFGQPRSLPENDVTISSVTADDLFYYTLADNTSRKIELNGAEQSFDIRDPIINASNSMLFFRNGKDDSLYRVNLK
jgi:hypothetical protein